MIDGFETSWSDNLDDLVQAMKDLPRAVSDSVLRSVNRQVGRRYVLERLKSDVPYESKDNRGALGISAVRGDKTAVSVGITSAAYYLRFVEGGTVERQGRGSISAQDRIGPILDSTVEPTANAWREEVGEGINTFLERRIKSLERKL
jgi:hypothetical protein